MTSTLTDPATASAAAAEFAAAEHKASELVELLSQPLVARRRAPLLFDLAVQLAVQAETHDAAHGLHCTSDDQNRSLAAALLDEAVLVSAIATTEQALATGRPRVRASDPLIEAAAATILDELAVAPTALDRYDLLNELYEAIEPVVGHHVAERIAWLGDCYLPTPAAPADAA